MDVLTSMTIFCRVVEAGSFTSIANETGSSQPTISKHIAALEQRLGTKLLNRSTRQLKLTEAGEQYYQHCLRILDDISQSEASIGEGQLQPTGNLRITAPVMFGRLFIAPILWEFLAMYPELSVEMIMDDRHIDIIKEGVDLAIRAGDLSDSNLIVKKIGMCPPQVLVASKSYLNKHGVPKSLADLQQHHCLLHAALAPNHNWTFDGPHGKESIRIKSRFVTNNRDTVNAAALAGVGIAITFLWTNVAHLKQGDLVRVLPDYEPTSAVFHALYPDRQFVPQKVSILIEHLRSYFDSPEKFQSLVEKAAT